MSFSVYKGAYTFGSLHLAPYLKLEKRDDIVFQDMPSLVLEEIPVPNIGKNQKGTCIGIWTNVGIHSIALKGQSALVFGARDPLALPQLTTTIAKRSVVLVLYTESQGLTAVPRNQSQGQAFVPRQDLEPFDNENKAATGRTVWTDLRIP